MGNEAIATCDTEVFMVHSVQKTSQFCCYYLHVLKSISALFKILLLNALVLESMLHVQCTEAEAGLVAKIICVHAHKNQNNFKWKLPYKIS